MDFFSDEEHEKYDAAKNPKNDARVVVPYHTA